MGSDGMAWILRSFHYPHKRHLLRISFLGGMRPGCRLRDGPSAEELSVGEELAEGAAI
jgi:hypothetical protein